MDDDRDEGTQGEAWDESNPEVGAETGSEIVRPQVHEAVVVSGQPPDPQPLVDPQKGTPEAALARRSKVLNYRKAGASLRTIATKLEISLTQVHRDLTHSLSELHETEINDARKIRALEAERLNDMFFAIWPQAKAGVPVAIDLALKLMDRRAKMYGLDAAVKVDVLLQEGMEEVLEKVRAVLDDEQFSKVLSALAMGAH